MKPIVFTLLISTFFIFRLEAQSRIFLGYEIDNFSIIVETNEGAYQFSAYSPNCIEIIFDNKRAKQINPSHALDKIEKTEFSTIEETEQSFNFSAGNLRVEINKNPLRIAYFRGSDLLLTENNGFQTNENGFAVDFAISSEEVLYGAGARALGMNRRGNRLELYNKAHYGYEEYSQLMNYTMPIVLSSKKYLIHFDNPEIGFLDLDSKHSNTLTYESIGGRQSYQIISTESWESIVKEFTHLTGNQPLPPRWAFGNFASRFGYHSENETRYTVNKFEEDDIPLDAVILDLYWFGKDIQGTMGNLDFYLDSFPAPKKMVDDFLKNGIKTILITEPFILTTSKRWKDAVKENILAKDSLGNPFVYDFYFGNTGLIDIYSENGHNWLWKRYKELIDFGISGFWGDLGEPEVHPAELWHQTGSANQKHNVYGHDWAGLIFNGYQEYYPNTRPFILMRSGYSGSQKYGIIPWSGDVNRTWGGLKPQMEISLQMGMQGISYMHSDLGGFAGNNDDSELYIRWLQYGVFQPVFRPHAQESVPSEPVFKDDKTKSLAKQAIDLRYSLLPYNYTMAKENSTNGMPLMRPLLFECPQDSSAFTVSSSYLWGLSFLITPITDSSIEETKVFFPKKDIWFDFYTGERIDLRTDYTDENCLQEKTVKVELSHIPTFVKAGSFIPTVSGLMNTDQYEEKIVDINFYYDDQIQLSNGMLYEDDGKSKVVNNEYNQLDMVFTSKKKLKHIFINAHIGYNSTTSVKNYNIIIHNLDHGIKKCKWNRATIPFSTDSKRNVLRIENVPIENGINSLKFVVK
jgi:alpha-glucosidase (family GH31 glycosyl hydrolase)